MAGFDHYVLGLELLDEGLLLHDPAGHPYAVLPVADLLDAWRAESIGWKLGSYTIRSHFEQLSAPGRPEMIARALPAVRANVHRPAEGTGRASGPAALRQLAAVVRDGPPEHLERNLIVFALPTVARRAVDASRFLAEAGLPVAARAMADQAVLWGRACSSASRSQWSAAAELLDRLAATEQRLASAL
jgi:hypothetical protein